MCHRIIAINTELRGGPNQVVMLKKLFAKENKQESARLS
jgi:hypothetical protein